MKPKIKSRTDLVAFLALPLLFSALLVGIFYSDYFVKLAPANIVFLILAALTVLHPRTWQAKPKSFSDKKKRLWFYIPLIFILQIGFVCVFLSFNTGLLSVMPPLPKLLLMDRLTGHNALAPAVIWSMYLLVALAYLFIHENHNKPMTSSQAIGAMLSSGKLPLTWTLTVDLMVRFGAIFMLATTFGFYVIAWVNVIGSSYLIPVVASFQKEHLVIFILFMMVLIQKGIERQWNSLAGKTKNFGVWYLIGVVICIVSVLIVHAGLIMFVGKDPQLKQLFMPAQHKIFAVSSVVCYSIVLWSWFIGFGRLLGTTVARLSVGRRNIIVVLVNMILPIGLSYVLYNPAYHQQLVAFLSNDKLRSQVFLIGFFSLIIFLIANKRSGWSLLAGETDATEARANPRVKSLKQMLKISIVYVCVALTGLRVIAIFDVYSYTAWCCFLLTAASYFFARTPKSK